MSGFPCSAGGTGVLLNVDRVAEQLEDLGYPAIQVRGLVDSGWFLDNKQYRGTDCVDTITCAPTEAIRRGIRCLGGRVQLSCRTLSVQNACSGEELWGTGTPLQPNPWLWLQVLEWNCPRALSSPIQGGQGMELLLWLQSVPNSAL
jgi:hypothetical protein